MRTLRRFGLAALVPVAAIVLFATPANVSNHDVDVALEAVQVRMLELERDNVVLRAHIADLERRANVDDNRFHDMSLRVATQERALDARDEGDPGSISRTLESQVEELVDVLAHFRREGDDIIIEGANLHVRNGGGATDTTNGVGNLIVGYNEERPAGNDRRGSHVVVLGSRNNYLGHGGIVAGTDNEISGAGASVLGGTGNIADGPSATVLGGVANQASGDGAVVAGGGFNLAGGRYAVVGGGMRNAAEGDVSVVSRGCDTTVTTCGGD